MNRNIPVTIATAILFLLEGVACLVRAQDRVETYPAMAPVDRYLMADRDTEIALARSAAPAAISRDRGGPGSGKGWLPDCNRGEKRFYLSCGAVVDVSGGQPGVLEFQNAWPGLL
jgi:hypothetical protein